MLNILRTFLAIIGFLIALQSLVLIVMGRVNFGTVLPFLIGAILIIQGIFWHRTRQFYTESAWLNRLWYASWGLFSFWLISFIMFAVTLQKRIEQSHQPLPSTVAAIIVLGSGTIDNRPMPALAKRLDTAAPLIKTHPNVIAVTSGGVDYNATRSEGAIMASYLNETYDIPFERILVEGKSTSTAENLIYIRPLLEQKSISVTDPIAIVTSDFHIIRSGAIARRQGYTKPILVASPTPLITRYNSWFREYFAFISGWLLDEY